VEREAREQKGSHIAEAVIFRLQGFPDDGRCGKAGLKKGGKKC